MRNTACASPGGDDGSDSANLPPSADALAATDAGLPSSNPPAHDATARAVARIALRLQHEQAAFDAVTERSAAELRAQTTAHAIIELEGELHAVASARTDSATRAAQALRQRIDAETALHATAAQRTRAELLARETAAARLSIEQRMLSATNERIAIERSLQSATMERAEAECHAQHHAEARRAAEQAARDRAEAQSAADQSASAALAARAAQEHQRHHATLARIEAQMAQVRLLQQHTCLEAAARATLIAQSAGLRQAVEELRERKLLRHTAAEAAKLRAAAEAALTRAERVRTHAALQAARLAQAQLAAMRARTRAELGALATARKQLAP